jgi:ADP-ribose pyrophosphatase YjhB (NUDIX family)
MKYATRVLLIRGDKFLVITMENNEKKFNLPGGEFTLNEDFIPSSIRHLKEQTGLIVLQKDLVHLVDIYDEDIYIRVFLSFIHTNKIKKKECSKIKWVPVRYLKKIKVISIDNREVYNKYNEYLTV